MGIFGMIAEAKQKLRRVQTERAYAKNIRQAEELRQLRQERTKLEGRAKLETLRQKEIEKIAKAKQTLGKGSAFQKLKTVAGKLQRAGGPQELKKDSPFSMGGNTQDSPFGFGSSSSKSPFVK